MAESQTNTETPSDLDKMAIELQETTQQGIGRRIAINTPNPSENYDAMPKTFDLRTYAPNLYACFPRKPKETIKTPVVAMHYKFCDNSIRTARYNVFTFVPLQILSQFSRVANLYFLFISCIQAVPGWSPTGQFTTLAPLIVFVILSMCREAYDDYQRHKQDKEGNTAITRRLDRTLPVLSWKECQFQDLVVGDVVLVRRDEDVPADLVLLATSEAQGLCYIETASLDGETNLKQRQALKPIQDYFQSTGESSLPPFSGWIAAESPHDDLYSFEGYIDPLSVNSPRLPLTIHQILLRGSTLRNTGWAWGVVTYSGEETKIRLNATSSIRTKSPYIEKRINQIVLFFFCLVLFLAFLSSFLNIGWRARWNGFDPWYADDGDPNDGQPNTYFSYTPFSVWITTFFNMVVLYNTLIPISLYVTMEIVKLFQTHFINSDLNMYDSTFDTPAQAKTSSLNEDLGQVRYVFSDKTGTLTENIMMFRKLSAAGTAWSCDVGAMASASTLDVSPPEVLQDQVQPWDNSIIDQAVATKAFEVSSLKRKARSGSGNVQEEFASNPELRVLYTATGQRRTLKRSLDDIDKQRGMEQLQALVQNKQIDKDWKTMHPARAREARLLMRAIALCHGVLPVAEEQVSGGGVNSPTSMATESVAQSPSTNHSDFQSSNPDELALVRAARDVGFTLMSRTSTDISICTPTGLERYEILDTIEFDSTRKRSSIILKTPDLPDFGGSIIVCLTKGADSIILPRLDPPSSPAEENLVFATQRHIASFAEEGLRTLVYAYKAVSDQEFQDWHKAWAMANTSMSERSSKMLHVSDQMETHLHLLGATGIEDRLQQGVPETIESLRRAGIGVWMLTGDKRETAITIGNSCGLIKDQSHIMYISGETIQDIMASIAACQSNMVRWMSREKPSGETDTMLHTVIVIEGDVMTKIQQTDEEHGLTGLVPLPPKRKKGDNTVVVNGFGFDANQAYEVTGNPSVEYLAQDYWPQMDGKTSPLLLRFLRTALCADSVICCRFSPAQKAMVSGTVRRWLNKTSHGISPVTLAVGDGLNDIPMLQSAHVGIGITGREGLAAARAADYSIAQFRYLQPLLFIHGRWNYMRICNFVLGTFYKCVAFYFTQFWFQIYTGWSGTSLYEPWTLTCYNILFASIPVMVIGIYEQDLDKRTLIALPELYRFGTQNKGLEWSTFVRWMGQGLIHSIVFDFFNFCWYGAIPYLFGNADEGDDYIYSMGVEIYTVVILVVTAKVLLVESRYWTWWSFFAALFSIGTWIIWNVVYQYVWPALGTSTGWEVKGMWSGMWSSGRGAASFFFILLLQVITCLVIVDLTWKVLLKWFLPRKHSMDIWTDVEYWRVFSLDQKRGDLEGKPGEVAAEAMNVK